MACRIDSFWFEWEELVSVCYYIAVWITKKRMTVFLYRRYRSFVLSASYRWLIAEECFAFVSSDPSDRSPDKKFIYSQLICSHYYFDVLSGRIHLDDFEGLTRKAKKRNRSSLIDQRIHPRTLRTSPPSQAVHEIWGNLSFNNGKNSVSPRFDWHSFKKRSFAIRSMSSATHSNVSTSITNDRHCCPRGEVANLIHCSWFHRRLPRKTNSRTEWLFSSNNSTSKYSELGKINRPTRGARSRMSCNWAEAHSPTKRSIWSEDNWSSSGIVARSASQQGIIVVRWRTPLNEEMKGCNGVEGSSK